MKKAVFSIILISISLGSISQELNHPGYLYTTNGTYDVESEPLTKIPEDKIIPDTRLVLKDNDQNSYEVIKIGNQQWMAENLRTTKLNDGTSIPVVSDYKLWSSLISPAYCLYNNDTDKYKSKYGVLYNGYTVSTGKLCPSGWHVPTIEDWMSLISYCGEAAAGGKLKETFSWMSPNAGATNATGFAALPGGSRGNRGSFMDAGIRGHWWSSTEEANANFLNRTMSYSTSDVTGSSDNKQSGLSVRCLKNN